MILLTAIPFGYLTQIWGCVPILSAGGVVLGSATIAFGFSANSIPLLFVFRVIQGFLFFFFKTSFEFVHRLMRVRVLSMIRGTLQKK